MQLPTTGAGGDHEIVEDAGQLPQVEHDDVASSILFGGPSRRRGPGHGCEPPAARAGRWIVAALVSGTKAPFGCRVFLQDLCLLHPTETLGRRKGSQSDGFVSGPTEKQTRTDSTESTDPHGPIPWTSASSVQSVGFVFEPSAPLDVCATPSLPPGESPYGEWSGQKNKRPARVLAGAGRMMGSICGPSAED